MIAMTTSNSISVKAGLAFANRNMGGLLNSPILPTLRKRNVRRYPVDPALSMLQSGFVLYGEVCGTSRNGERYALTLGWMGVGALATGYGLCQGVDCI